MKLRKVLMVTAILSLTAGCQPIETLKAQFPKKSAPAATVNSLTFKDVIAKTQSDPLEGKVLAEMDGFFDPSLERHAFVTQDGKPLFVYQESTGSMKVISVFPDQTIKQVKFPGYNLKRAVLNNQILYAGFKGNQVVKLNTDSFDYSEVDKAELDRSRAVTDEFKLPGKEQAVHTQEGFIYTLEGFIFDIKKHEYLNEKNKKKFYEKADFGYGSYLFEIEPRLDQAVNLKAIKAEGEKTVKGKSYGIHLDLPNGYDVKNLEFAIGYDGKLYLFAPGVEEKGKVLIKMFEIPLDTFNE